MRDLFTFLSKVITNFMLNNIEKLFRLVNKSQRASTLKDQNQDQDIKEHLNVKKKKKKRDNKNMRREGFESAISWLIRNSGVH
jgi:hypothetical protein